MFTKYTDVAIPTNYSGNRFRVSSQDNTKIHKGESISPQQTRTSVSPSFQASINNAANNMKETKEECFDCYSLKDESLFNKLSNEDSKEKCEVNDEEISKNATRGEEFLSNFKSSSLGQFLSSIGHDDLLLIALIILLSGEQSSTDTIILLSLLLLYH